MLRLDGNHVCNVITPTPTFTKATNKGNPNTRSYLLHNYMTYAQILTTLIYFNLHSGYREFHGSFHRPETLRRSSGSSVSDVIWLRLLRHLKPTRSRLWTPATSLTLTSSTLRPPSTHSTLTHCFFFLSYRILGKNLTKKSGVQSENISINNVPCDP